MDIKEQDLVIVRGINSTWINENFTKMWIGFGGSPIGVPVKDSKYVGLYQESPISAITHIGIVDRIDRGKNFADFYLNALIKLETPIKPKHQIRKHEYWKLEDFGISNINLEIS